MVNVSEKQLRSMIRESIISIMESLNETPMGDRNMSDEEKKQRRLDRDADGAYWRSEETAEKHRQMKHRASRNQRQDDRNKGQKMRRGEISGKLINSKY